MSSSAARDEGAPPEASRDLAAEAAANISAAAALLDRLGDNPRDDRLISELVVTQIRSAELAAAILAAQAGQAVIAAAIAKGVAVGEARAAAAKGGRARRSQGPATRHPLHLVPAPASAGR